MGLATTERDGVLGTYRGSAKAAVANPLWVALLTTDATDGAGTGAVEVSTGTWTNYARKSIASTTAGWTAPAADTGEARHITNAALVDFGTATISGAAPTVVAFALYDASTAGNFIGHGTITSAQTINNGDPVSFAIGALKLVV